MQWYHMHLRIAHNKVGKERVKRGLGPNLTTARSDAPQQSLCNCDNKAKQTERVFFCRPNKNPKLAGKYGQTSRQAGRRAAMQPGYAHLATYIHPSTQ